MIERLKKFLHNLRPAPEPETKPTIEPETEPKLTIIPILGDTPTKILPFNWDDLTELDLEDQRLIMAYYPQINLAAQMSLDLAIPYDGDELLWLISGEEPPEDDPHSYMIITLAH